MINPTGNAIKFTDAGWVEVRIDAHLDAQTSHPDAVQLRFAVCDTPR
ncbi:hypothetical protein [Rhabdochromatium marinum]|nr:hypothetical protein [Rhabdochromatium marinum]